MTTPTTPSSEGGAISRQLLGNIIDEVFDGAIEDASIIEEIYAVIKREGGDGWQDIATAPTHRGAKILGWCVFPAGAEVRVCKNEPPYLDEGPEPFWYSYGVRQNVTHWQPLPKPPSEIKP